MVPLPNEMIIAKNGRKMSPFFKVNFSGLEMSAMLEMKLQFIQGENRYIYRKKGSGAPNWQIKGKAEHLIGIKGNNDITKVFMFQVDFEYDHGH